MNTSDHAPMLPHLSKQINTGPKPFRFFTHWAKCEGRKEVIAKDWSTLIEGYPLF